MMQLWEDKYKIAITVKQVRDAIKIKIGTATRAELKLQNDLKILKAKQDATAATAEAQ